MYFPHNMDFRGRAYPMPPTLNHLGNDLCRGLLHFDEAKPLGARGWRWMKIHLANLHGYDKHSFVERENYTMDNINEILDSVDNPLTVSFLKNFYIKNIMPNHSELLRVIVGG